MVGAQGSSEMEFTSEAQGGVHIALKRLQIAAVVLLLAGVAIATPRAAVADASQSSQKVSFITDDRVTLRGHLYGDGRTGVILAHMYPADQQDWADFAGVLAVNGYQALTFDFRGFSESDGESGVEFAGHDLEAAYDFIKPRVERIFLIGASMGSDASILVAASHPVAGVICISTPIEFRGLDVGEAIRQVRAPILFITSKEDSLVAGQDEILYTRAHQPRTLRIFPGRAHGSDLLYGPYATEVRNLLVAFIRDHDPGAKLPAAAYTK